MITKISLIPLRNLSPHASLSQNATESDDLGLKKLTGYQTVGIRFLVGLWLQQNAKSLGKDYFTTTGNYLVRRNIHYTLVLPYLSSGKAKDVSALKVLIRKSSAIKKKKNLPYQLNFVRLSHNNASHALLPTDTFHHAVAVMLPKHSHNSLSLLCP